MNTRRIILIGDPRAFVGQTCAPANSQQPYYMVKIQNELNKFGCTIKRNKTADGEHIETIIYRIKYVSTSIKWNTYALKTKQIHIMHLYSK